MRPPRVPTFEYDWWKARGLGRIPRLEYELSVFDDLEVRVFALLAALGIPEDQWPLYMAFAKRLLQIGRHFLGQTYLDEKISLLEEFELRGLDISVLKRVQDICEDIIREENPDWWSSELPALILVGLQEGDLDLNDFVLGFKGDWLADRPTGAGTVVRHMKDHHPSDSAEYSSYGAALEPLVSYEVSIVSFWLKKSGNPTGNAYVRIYNADANHYPTGAALGTSAPLDVSTLSAVQYLEKSFTFATPVPLTAGNEYCIVYENPAVGTIDGTNYIQMYVNTVVTPPSQWKEKIRYVNGTWQVSDGWPRMSVYVYESGTGVPMPSCTITRGVLSLRTPATGADFIVTVHNFTKATSDTLTISQYEHVERDDTISLAFDVDDELGLEITQVGSDVEGDTLLVLLYTA